MIATAGDSLVILSRKQEDGSYQSEGYSNSRIIIRPYAEQRIHIKIPRTHDSDDADENPFSYSDEPRLYGVPDLKPGDRFTLGSDGFLNNILGSDYSDFGSKQLQSFKNQRPFLLQTRFQLLNLMLESTAGREDSADYFHDWALGNMKTPVAKFEFSGEEANYPPSSKDNIFAISYEHGTRVKNANLRLPSDYQALEKIYDLPPPPFKAYQQGDQHHYAGILTRYLDPLKSLYGSKVGEEVAHTLANLYMNFPDLEAKFNPALLAGASDTSAMNDLFQILITEVASQPEMMSGDNKRFIAAAQQDLKKIQDSVHPFEEAAQGDSGLIYQKYQRALEYLFKNQSGAAALHFATLYKNFSELPPLYSSWNLKEGETYLLGRDGPYEGRQGPCEILINHEEVAPLHLKIFDHNGKWFMQDAQSTFGTFLDGHRIPPGKPIPLSTVGISRIRLGRVKELSFVVGKTAATSCALWIRTLKKISILSSGAPG
jgi:hypothetical protein